MSVSSCVRGLVRACLLFAATAAVADTPNRDPNYNAPFGYAQVTSFLGASTYLSARPRRLLVNESGTHFLVGTGQTAIGVSPAQSAITIVSRNADGSPNTSFFGTGRRAFKLAPGGQVTDTVVEDAVLIPKFGMAIVGRFIGLPGGYIVVLDFAGNPVGSFASTGVRFFSDLQPAAVAYDGAGFYIVGTSFGGASLTDLRIRALGFTGSDRTGWGASGIAAWGYIDDQSRTDYDDRPASAAVDGSGRLVVVGSSRRAGSAQQIGHVVVIGSGGTVAGSFGDPLPPCAPGGVTEFEYARVVTSGNNAYLAFRALVDNASCPTTPRQLIGARVMDVGTLLTSLVGLTSTRAACCGGDAAGLAVSDIARDSRGRVYVSFNTSPPGSPSRGHLVRFNPAAGSTAPDPDFGDAGHGTYNLDMAAADATLTALAVDPAQSLLAAGAITTDLAGNRNNVDYWSFRVLDARIFGDGFEF